MQIPLSVLAVALEVAGAARFGVCRWADALPVRHCGAVRRLPEEPSSVVMLAFPYAIFPEAPRNVAHYAVHDDYHAVIGARLAAAAQALLLLYPDAAIAAFTDDSPIREVHTAAACGLGSVGENGLLLSGALGSNVFLGALVTDIDIEPTPPCPEQCLHCGRCVQACPTGALADGKPLLRDRCRSHITQKRRALSDWEQEQVRAGGLVCGCDLCTDACPVNLAARDSKISRLSVSPQSLLTRENAAALVVRKPYNHSGLDVILRNLALVSE